MTTVRHFRQSLLWPLQLMPREGDRSDRRPWEQLLEAGGAQPWHAVVDEYTGEASGFHERHYNEFVTFLPYVQRFLYGDGSNRGRTGGASSMQVLRRDDVRQVRVTLQAGEAPVTLQVEHIDLYFFYDVDVVMLNVEVCADDLPLAVAQEVLGTQAVDLARAVAEVAQTMQAQEVEAATVAALAQVEAAARLALTELATQEQAATAHPATL